MRVLIVSHSYQQFVLSAFLILVDSVSYCSVFLLFPVSHLFRGSIFFFGCKIMFHSSDSHCFKIIYLWVYCHVFIYF